MIEEIRNFVNWVRRRNPEAYTWRSYRSDLSIFLDCVGDRSPADILVADIDDFVNAQVAQGMKATTVNRRLAAISVMYTYLADEQPGLVSPVRPFRHRLRVGHRLPRSVHPADVQAFFAVIDSARDRAIFLLMLRCGLRISEVAGLTLRDLYLQEDQPRLQVQGKGGKQRSVYLSGQALAGLRAYLRERPRADCDGVFLNYKGAQLAVIGIQKRLERYRKQAGVHFTAHQLRHNFANDLVAADVPVPSIQYLMGHAWIDTTQKYLAVNDPKVRADFLAAVARLPEWDV